MKIPPFLLVHTVSVETPAGDGPFGPTFNAAIDLRCMVDEQTRLVRDNTGNQVVSSTQIFHNGDPTDTPVGSRITLPSGRTATVLTVSDRNGGILPVPSHVELALT